MSDLRYRIRHRTAYKYTGRIDLSHSLVHLFPREEPGQETLGFRLEVQPEPHFRSERKDYFGNTTHYFSIQQSHDSLEVLSTITIEKSKVEAVLPQSTSTWDSVTDLTDQTDQSDLSDLSKTWDDGIPLLNYLAPSAACPSLPELDQFLRPSLHPGRETMSLVHELMLRIYDEFDYVTGSTDNSTPILTVLKEKQGVCQDFAHLMIAALRRIGIPARYVSGYLETMPVPGQEKLVGADASHAWVEAWTPSTGWVGFDPTNQRIPAHQHIKICHGRDYFDVQPLRGIFLGSGAQKLLVQVDVERI